MRRGGNGPDLPTRCDASLGRPKVGAKHVGAACIVAGLLQGCAAASSLVSGLADAPTQIVMVNTTDQPGAFQTVYVTAFPPGGGEVGSQAPNSIGPSPPATQPAAGRIPPGIAANNDKYVVAAWRTGDGVSYALDLHASGNGRSWASAGCSSAFTGTALERASSPQASRPAVAYFPARRTWFVAIRNNTDSSIMLAEFEIAGSEPPYQCRAIGQPRPAGVSSAYAPALGYAGDNLVVVYVTPNPAGFPAPPRPPRPTELELFAVTSRDGMTFTPAPGVQILDPTIAPPTPPQSLEPVGPPFLSNTLGELTLTTGFRPSTNRPGNPSTGVFTSTGGIAWSQVVVFPAIFGLGPASAGGASDRIVAIPRQNRQGFLVSIGGTTPASRAIVESYGVGLAKGPGPTATTTHFCAPGQVLTARTASQSITGFGFHPTAFATSGDFELLCSPPTTHRSGICPANTTHAAVRGNPASGGYIVECWRRYPGQYM